MCGCVWLWVVCGDVGGGRCVVVTMVVMVVCVGGVW